MSGRSPEMERVHQVMGAAHVFCSTITRLMERTLAEATDAQLALSQLKLLLLIARPGQRFKVTDVAEFLGVTNAAASRAIDRLVQRGLVDRSISAQDRRAVDLALTGEGERLLDRFVAIRDRDLVAVLADFPAEGMVQVAELLDRLSVRLLALEETSGSDACLRCGVHFREDCVVREVLGRECVVHAGETADGGTRDDRGG